MAGEGHGHLGAGCTALDTEPTDLRCGTPQNRRRRDRPLPRRALARLADVILADTEANALHADGHWQRAPDDPALDAALLLPPLRGALPADDPRTRPRCARTEGS